jgi:ferrous iron transport protein A
MESSDPWRPSDTAQSLAQLHKGARGLVRGVAETQGSGATIGDVAGSTIARRLVELGFVQGERIEVIEEVRPGGDPIAVRIGSSIFALRRREAQAVMIDVEAT